MIQVEYLQDGTLIRHYSDSGKMLLQNETGIMLSDPIDAVPCLYTYSELDLNVEDPAEEYLPMAEFINFKSELNNFKTEKSYPSLVASGSLPIPDTQIRYGGNKNYPTNHFIIYLYIPADSQSRSLDCKINNKSIGKITDIDCNYNQIIAFEGKLKGQWVLEFDQFESSAFNSLAAFRNTNISAAATQKHLRFFGKGNITEINSGSIQCMSNIPLPIGTEYEIWAC